MSPAISSALNLELLTIVPPPGFKIPNISGFIRERRRLGIGLERAADLLGIPPIELAAVERGKRVFLNGEAVELAIGLLRESQEIGD